MVKLSHKVLHPGYYLNFVTDLMLVNILSKDISCLTVIPLSMVGFDVMTAVIADVNAPRRSAFRIGPITIQMIPMSLPMNDLGVISPYLNKKVKEVDRQVIKRLDTENRNKLILIEQGENRGMVTRVEICWIVCTLCNQGY